MFFSHTKFSVKKTGNLSFFNIVDLKDPGNMDTSVVPKKKT